MAVGVGMGEGRVVDHLDAGGVGVYREEGGKRVLAVDHVRHHDQTAAWSPVVTNHFSPLRRKPSAVGCADGGDPARVRAGVALGHRVGVADLAAKRGE